MTEEETLALVDRISAAFAAHDIDAMVSHFAENGAFVNAVGPDYFGTCYQGRTKSGSISSLYSKSQRCALG